jgi:mannose-6-phosphate isomerase-like protein (cupin superfamily)
MKKLLGPSILAICLAAAAAAQAQQGPPQRGGPGGAQPQPTFREDALDPSAVNPATDPNLDLFIGDYHAAKPRTAFGKLVYRDILTKLGNADPVKPVARGAVLTGMNAVSFVTLEPGATAGGKVKAGERQIFLANGAGAGKITVGGKSWDLKDGKGFVLTPDVTFSMTTTSKVPLSFYVRTEDIPKSAPPAEAFTVSSRFDNDRRIGAHWVHTCNGGPPGLNLCTIGPHTMPQPHSHPGEEAWIMVKGTSILSLGKELRVMTPGQAYRIPPTGLATHSNINLGDEPVQMIYMGPADRTVDAAWVASRGGKLQNLDFSRLDNSPLNPAGEPDVSMFMGNWQDAYPQVRHGNMYWRDMLTSLQGPDPLHPTRKGAVLTNATAVSYAMLEPGSNAHKLDGEFKGVQETFVVHSGTGSITVGDRTLALSKDKAFILTPGMDFKITATGSSYLTFYVVSEKVPEGVTPKTSLEVTDNGAKPQSTTNWFNKERALITKADGLAQYGAINQVELKTMAMSRPYSAAKDVEEIWIATDGDVDLLFGKLLRKLPAGTAYRVPSTGITAHAKINVSGKPAKFLSMVK